MVVPKIIKLLLVTMFALGFTIGLGACTYGPVYHAPPPHAKALPRHYHYYPHADVYFDIHLGYYYYRSNKAWLKVRYLPRHIHLHPAYRVSLRVDYDKPYLRHKEHHKIHHPRIKYKVIKEKERRIRNREEREHNFRRHEEYLKKYEKRRR
jgi:hypothetical protein